MKNPELNLLIIFNAIMAEGSVTRAAQRLGLTQPAVSNAIAKMRDTWRDPLFVKKGRQIEPTSFASNLWQQIQDPLNALSSALNTSEFSPANSQRKFRIAASDNIVDMVWLPLLHTMAEQAPYIDIYSHPFSVSTASTLLHEAKVDLAIGPMIFDDRGLRSTFLFETNLVAAMGKQHPLAGKPLNMNDYLAAKHLLVSSQGDNNGVVDEELQRLGLRRRVALTVNHFSAVPKLLMQSDLIAVIPNTVAMGSQFHSELWVTEPPLEIASAPISLIWHTRHDRDEGMMWMRDKLETIISSQFSRCSGCNNTTKPIGMQNTLY